jgi:hypothetical protein
MERRALALLVSVVAAAVLAASAEGTTRSRSSASSWPALATAGPFLLAEIHDKTAGHWALTWRTLYPAHQAVAPKRAFVRCESETPLDFPLKSVHVVGVRREPVRIPGLAQPRAGVGVTIKVALEWYGPRDPVVFAYTFHLVPVHGRWTWLLSPGRYRLYADGGCGGGPAA